MNDDSNGHGADPSAITVLTINCWGLKYLSAQRRERLDEIGRRLAAMSEGVDDDDAAQNQQGDPAQTQAGRPPLSIVALQECWCQEDFAVIHAHTRHALPHAKFFLAGVWGAGLAVLSRWPIVASSMHPYALNGRPTAVWRGDWFVGKGVAAATLRLSPRCTVEVLVTHTHAPYESDLANDQNSYLVHQLAQTWDMGKRIRAAAAAAAATAATAATTAAAAAAAAHTHLILAMGDFNMTPLSLPYQLMQLAPPGPAHCSIFDAWRVLHPHSSLGPVHHRNELARQRLLQSAGSSSNSGSGSGPGSASASASGFTIPSAATNLAENGCTSNNVTNTWRWSSDSQKRLRQHHRSAALSSQDLRLASALVVDPNTTPDPHGQRLDYVFYASSAWTATAARVALTETHPTLGCSLSDHYAVEVTLSTTPTPTSTSPPVTPATDTTVANATTLPAAPAAASAAPPLLSVLTSPIAVYDEALAATEAYMARESRQRFWRAAHFYVALAVSIGCLVAVWWCPRPFVAFLLMLLSTLGLLAGTIDGLLALLFFSSELRLLRQFHWELSNARTMAAATANPSPSLGQKSSAIPPLDKDSL